MDRIERIRQSFNPPRLQQSDTHDYINHHDPDFAKRKRGKSDEWQDHENDMTDISVESLIIYLNGLIGQNSDDDNASEEKHIAPSMQQVIAAYTHEERQPDHHQDLPQRVPLTSDEKNRIEQLIGDLKGLLSRDIEHITLLPADSFIDCIEKTVEKYGRL